MQWHVIIIENDNYDWENDEMYDLYSWTALLYDLNNELRIEPILLPIIYPIF